MSWHDTPQQAIEDYLDALLHDDLLENSLEESSVKPVIEHHQVYDESPSEKFSEPYDESLQARQLRESMLQFNPVAKPLASNFERPVLLDEPFLGAQVILPNINLPSLETKVETLADVIQEIENKALVVEEQIEEEQIVEEQIVEEQIVDTSEMSITGQPPSPPGWKDGRPVWAQERFECLLFKVKGLTLAVPLVELGGIIKIEKHPTPLFGQPSWFMGILRNNKMNVSMIDTAQWVLPPALIKKIDPYKLVIRIHESTWGLACNEVDRSISLKPEQVRWRTSLGKRPWLAGTVIEHMCALIDVAAFARLLKEGHGDLEPINLKALNNIK
ncbi:MAG TPA: chemotaxis protein CheW [Marinospirillum sp.]|uniref:chemotaxis protein CheW n=1 Tax=Marinospirillum sp. TaxID=2183934 RepID=UPI002B461D17|nr:chemotaxis protein CheW [Marinospirillum sp.]HKM16418.1 chemotaxis protein CheW [Marinospirillum sp.]